MAPTTTTAPTTSTTTTTTVLSPVTTQPAAEPTPSPFVSTWLPILAIAISLWSAYNSWRSRRTSERSAGLTEQRRREEEAPTIEYVSANEAPEEGIRVVNETMVATSPCASPSCRRGMSRPQSTPSRSSTTSLGWDSLSGGSRREKPGTLGRSDPANPDFWIFAGLTRAPTHNGRHAAADPRLHDQELQGVGYPYLRYPVQATSALRNLAVSLCPSVNRAVRTCATREQDPSIPPLTCEFPGSVGSRITPRPGSPTAITWPGTRRGSPTYG
jgi:hypothetical protein